MRRQCSAPETRVSLQYRKRSKLELDGALGTYSLLLHLLLRGQVNPSSAIFSLFWRFLVLIGRCHRKGGQGCEQ